ncbi:hypothetical protein [Rothia halotolerans]|uniref:hypothetical protein n=1 Tax=Rothia halotolerans TaxID=405770 RepID=UPI00101DC71B|nr:hypothetical protein [Rothia halotolerans]
MSDDTTNDQRPAVHQAVNGGVRIHWPKLEYERADVFVFPDGSIEINPLANVYDRPRIRIDGAGSIEVIEHPTGD